MSPFYMWGSWGLDFFQGHIISRAQTEVVFQMCVSMIFNFMDHNLLRKLSQCYRCLDFFKCLIALDNDKINIFIHIYLYNIFSLDMMAFWALDNQWKVERDTMLPLSYKGVSKQSLPKGAYGDYSLWRSQKSLSF